MSIVKKTVRDIKSLKIQGATNVRKKAISAIAKSVKSSKEKNPANFRKEFFQNCSLLFNSRPTEPELRTAIRIVKQSIADKNLSVSEMKEKIIESIQKYEKNRAKAMEDISRFGANMIEPNSTILTICHSSTVVKMLIKAKKKINHVYCLETRPRYQGRITARALSDAGIKVTLLVDNAASTVMKKCDYFFSGTDAFLADGDIINKIGTNHVSILCKKYDVKHYAVMSTHKFEPSTLLGKQQPIEQRDVSEVWSEKEMKKFGAKKIKLMNPAFDRTDSSTIEGIICEIGIFTPQNLVMKLIEK
ncbi:MAG: S-methyl-5-thioribose-1-phosphate isomerase [Candidatus Diapherotrites archaeon]|uniref:S-methyl-5-thioribose-1-phosphate isomerase n=1 Tax=Candidatus Iainarchaeum sp. TaxID=3101447 RepID=A0A7K4BYC9_9ARCH|nr:S-methyl-5-thioribose-1-phosphate isomerase [Candidatus Diapherotrites archaeon]